MFSITVTVFNQRKKEDGVYACQVVQPIFGTATRLRWRNTHREVPGSNPSERTLLRNRRLYYVACFFGSVLLSLLMLTLAVCKYALVYTIPFQIFKCPYLFQKRLNKVFLNYNIFYKLINIKGMNEGMNDTFYYLYSCE